MWSLGCISQLVWFSRSFLSLLVNELTSFYESHIELGFSHFSRPPCWKPRGYSVSLLRPLVLGHSFICSLTHSVTFLSARYVPGPGLGSTNTGRPLCCISAMSVVRDGSSYQDMQWLQTGWRDRGFCSCSFKSQGQETPLSYGDTDVKNGTSQKGKHQYSILTCIYGI